MSEQNRHADVVHQPPAQGIRTRLLSGLPVTDERILAAGIDTSVLTGGEGPPVVLLHGAGEVAAGWMRVIPQLARQHRVVVPELPGHGASGIGDGPLDADRLLRWLGEIVEQTCPTPPVVVGRVAGGELAARFAARHSSRIERLVMVDSLGLGPFRPSPRFVLAIARFAVHPAEGSMDRLFRACMVDFDGLREELGKTWDALSSYALDCARSPEQKLGARRVMSAVGSPLPAEDLARITVPVSLIWGREDLQVRLRVAAAASARHGWPLYVVDGAGDDPAFERPEEFLAALGMTTQS